MNLHKDKKFGFVLVTDPSPAVTVGAWKVLGSGVITTGVQATPSITVPSSSTTFEIKSLEGVLYDPSQVNQPVSLTPAPVSSPVQQPGNLMDTNPANGGIIPYPIPFYAPLYFLAGGKTYKISQQSGNYPGSGQDLVDVANSQNFAPIRLSVFPLM
jgi:hypothetical protein